MIELKSYFAKTHQGPHLNLNEDDVLVEVNSSLFAIFDGFGGSLIGDKCVEKAKEKIHSFFTKITNDPDSTLPFFYSSHYLLETNALVNSLHLAQRSILEENKDNTINERGGVSVCVAMISENVLSIVSIGNCLSLLVRDGRISVLSSPDIISPFGGDNKALNNVTFPLKALGLYEQFEVSIKEYQLKEGDRVLFLTDGVYSQTSIDDIEIIVNQNKDDDKKIISNLFQIANDRGNQDNQSAIAISV